MQEQKQHIPAIYFPIKQSRKHRGVEVQISINFNDQIGGNKRLRTCSNELQALPQDLRRKTQVYTPMSVMFSGRTLHYSSVGSGLSLLPLVTLRDPPSETSSLVLNTLAHPITQASVKRPSEGQMSL